MGVGAGLYLYDVVVKEFTFAISSPDEFLLPFIFAVLLLTHKNFKCSFSPVEREIFKFSRSDGVYSRRERHPAKLWYSPLNHRKTETFRLLK